MARLKSRKVSPPRKLASQRLRGLGNLSAMTHDTTMDNVLHHIVHEDYRALEPVPAGMKAVLPQLWAGIGDIRCVLFDVYGTLLVSGAGEVGTVQDVDREPGDGERFLDILRSCGIVVGGAGDDLSGASLERRVDGVLDGLVREEHRRLKSQGADFPEIDIRQIWEDLLKRCGKEGFLALEGAEVDGYLTLDGLTLEKLSLRFEMARNPVSLMPGFPQITQTLQQRGYVTGIVSNAQFFTPVIIEALCGASLTELGFEEALCCWSYKLGVAKPSLSIFRPVLEILRKRGIRPEEILYLGNDMLNDVSTAQQCGCRAALFAGDKRSLRLRENSPAEHCKPELVITNLNQIEEILK